jgi:hypothetical protein
LWPERKSPFMYFPTGAARRLFTNCTIDLDNENEQGAIIHVSPNHRRSLFAALTPESVTVWQIWVLTTSLAVNDPGCGLQYLPLQLAACDPSTSLSYPSVFAKPWLEPECVLVSRWLSAPNSSMNSIYMMLLSAFMSSIKDNDIPPCACRSEN